MIQKTALVLLLCSLFCSIPLKGVEANREKKIVAPLSIYLSWSKTPHLSIIISWITPAPTKSKKSTKEELLTPSVSIQKEIRRGKKSSRWRRCAAISSPFPEGNPYIHHSVLIEKLQPDTLYRFRIDGFTVEHTFKTCPKRLKDPIRFVVGGDTYKERTLFRKINREAAQTNPLFAIIGGDIAYASPKNKKELDDGRKWVAWLQDWYETMQVNHQEDPALPSRLIPLITTIGNHDIKGRNNQSEEEAIFFYALFRNPFIDKSYYTLRFSSYLSLYLLDSGHAFPIYGAQKEWIEQEMKKDKNTPHKVAVYHIAAYPSVRPYYEMNGTQIRTEWIPIFDKYGLHVAFENNDHAYKRTFRIKNSKLDPKGVIYIGDGSWGVVPRAPKSTQEASYLEVTKRETQFCSVLLSPQFRRVVAINKDGKEIDSYEEKVDI